MPFVPKKTKSKVETEYRTIYLRKSINTELDRIAKVNNTSVNNVVVSMIERCLEESKDKLE